MEIKPGDKFGELTVIKKADKFYYYTCLCSCGKIKDIYKSSLILGKTRSCGHLIGDGIRKRAEKKIIGRKFGRLTVLKKICIEKNTYLCKCECGNCIEIPATNLLGGKTKSCGCLKSEISKKNMGKIKELGNKKVQENRIDGTIVHCLKQKISKNNKTGVKGVCLTKNGRYRVYINLRRKQISLGIYDTLDEAEKARLEAEKKYFKPIIEKKELLNSK